MREIMEVPLLRSDRHVSNHRRQPRKRSSPCASELVTCSVPYRHCTRKPRDEARGQEKLPAFDAHHEGHTKGTYPRAIVRFLISFLIFPAAERHVRISNTQGGRTCTAQAQQSTC